MRGSGLEDLDESTSSPESRAPIPGDIVMNAIEVTHASKIYRRYNRRRQFATLKSALLSRSLVRDLEPDETFAAVRRE